jgi:hypothetical protein
MRGRLAFLHMHTRGRFGEKDGAIDITTVPVGSFRQTGRKTMSRIMLAIAAAGLVFTAASETASAAPILPLPTAATASLDNLTDVPWRRRCWRDRWGRLHCHRVWTGGGDRVVTAGVTAGATGTVAGKFSLLRQPHKKDRLAGGLSNLIKP